MCDARSDLVISCHFQISVLQLNKRFFHFIRNHRGIVMRRRVRWITKPQRVCRPAPSRKLFVPYQAED